MNKYEDIYAPHKVGVEKWYLVGVTGGPSLIVCTTEILHTGQSEYGFINSLSPPFKTKEYLIKDSFILAKPCTECGGIVSANFMNNHRILEQNVCFSCAFWLNKIDAMETERLLIVNHQMYYIAPEDVNGPFRGFGGIKFVFVKNGELIESTNVWFNGDIPKRFWDRLPDNANNI